MLFGLFEAPIQLVPDGTLLFHLALIVGMVALLNATLLKPVNRILEERQRLTSGRLTEAEKAKIAAQDKWREYEKSLRDARAQGYALMEQERAAWSRDREQRVSGIKTEVAGWLAEEKAKIRTDEERARATLAANARNIALEISGHILNRPIGS